MLAWNIPFRVIGRSGHNANFVTERSEPLAQFSIVFGDPDQVGGIVDADDENAHQLTPRREGSREIAKLSRASNPSPNRTAVGKLLSCLVMSVAAAALIEVPVEDGSSYVNSTLARRLVRGLQTSDQT